MVSTLLGTQLQAHAVPDHGLAGHAPITLTIPSYRELGLGFSIRRPKRVDLQPARETEVPIPAHLALDAIHEGEDYWWHWNYDA